VKTINGIPSVINYDINIYQPHVFIGGTPSSPPMFLGKSIRRNWMRTGGTPTSGKLHITSDINHILIQIRYRYPNTIRYETTQPIVISEVYHDLLHPLVRINSDGIDHLRPSFSSTTRPIHKKVQIIQVYPSIRSIQMKQPQFFF
jgi:hypothetical protein